MVALSPPINDFCAVFCCTTLQLLSKRSGADYQIDEGPSVCRRSEHIQSSCTYCTLMFLARLAYLSVLWESSKKTCDGFTLAIITRRHRPSSDAFSRWVSLLSRYLTFPGPCRRTPHTPVTSEKYGHEKEEEAVLS